MLERLQGAAGNTVYYIKSGLRGGVVQKTIFVVDDSITNLSVVENALHEYYRVVPLTSASKMFDALEKFKADMILLDIEMPEMSGFDAIKKLKSDNAYSEIPVMFLTSVSDAASEAHSIELGAVDFVLKPFSQTVLLNRIKTHLHIDEIIRKRTEELVAQAEELLQLKNGIVFTMADLVENRDKNTGGHIDRTVVYMRILLTEMLAHGVYADEMRGLNLDLVVSSARLHDIGKIAISDLILNKPGKLTNEEFEIMKSHSTEGEHIITRAIQRTGNSEFLLCAKVIAAYHHERWNGMGYPYGLAGVNIPLLGRIMAVIDVYDALVSERPYKKAFTHEEALDIIKNESGQHFDPLIANVFVGISKEKLNESEMKNVKT
jgi:putative two-component system response regulator